MMRQYQEAKRACPDALLLFRMGDFYEMFFDDAKTAARVLNLALTSREKGENAIPMAGFPHHQLESYLGKLIAAGFRAAVCEQVEDPKKAKGLVKRELIRIVTPGTVTDDALLDPAREQFSGGRGARGSGRIGLGGTFHRPLLGRRFSATPIGRPDRPHRPGRVPAGRRRTQTLPSTFGRGTQRVPGGEGLNERMMLSRRPAWAFSLQTARETLAKHFGTATLEGFGFTDSPADIQAFAPPERFWIISTKRKKPRWNTSTGLCLIAPRARWKSTRPAAAAWKSPAPCREGRREGSLLAILDRTVTAMGSRLLAQWLANPLTDVALLRARHEAVDELVADASLCAELVETLRRVYDVERLLARVTTGRASPRDLGFLGRTLRCCPG